MVLKSTFIALSVLFTSASAVASPVTAGMVSVASAGAAGGDAHLERTSSLGEAAPLALVSQPRPRRSVLVRAAGADPWITTDGQKLYYTHTTGIDVRIWAADSLHGIAEARSVTAWSPSVGEAGILQNVWAPEIHFLHGKWYVYFSADDGHNHNHRMYVLESANGPLGPYEFKGRLKLTHEDRWAIDGTVVQYGGALYYAWSGWPGERDGVQHLYLARMENPWSVSPDPVVISVPSFGWESWVNEGPQFLNRDGKLFVVYSANLSWSDHYRLGLLELEGNDPMIAAAWKKRSAPVFDGVLSGDRPVVAPGHCSFFNDRDGQDWIIYHVARRPGAGWDREVRAQPWEWGSDGAPLFGTPLPLASE